MKHGEHPLDWTCSRCKAKGHGAKLTVKLQASHSDCPLMLTIGPCCSLELDRFLGLSK